MYRLQVTTLVRRTPVFLSTVLLILAAALPDEPPAEGCDDIGDEGHDIYTGYGRVNFGKTP